MNDQNEDDIVVPLTINLSIATFLWSMCLGFLTSPCVDTDMNEMSQFYYASSNIATNIYY